MFYLAAAIWGAGKFFSQQIILPVFGLHGSLWFMLSIGHLA
jgi:hypothetical protein